MTYHTYVKVLKTWGTSLGVARNTQRGVTVISLHKHLKNMFEGLYFICGNLLVISQGITYLRCFYIPCGEPPQCQNEAMHATCASCDVHVQLKKK